MRNCVQLVVFNEKVRLGARPNQGCVIVRVSTQAWVLLPPNHIQAITSTIYVPIGELLKKVDEWRGW